MVLTNALTPASHLALANGLAQSAASAARFCGPVIGGAVRRSIAPIAIICGAPTDRGSSGRTRSAMASPTAAGRRTKPWAFSSRRPSVRRCVTRVDWAGLRFCRVSSARSRFSDRGSLGLDRSACLSLRVLSVVPGPCAFVCPRRSLATAPPREHPHPSGRAFVRFQSLDRLVLASALLLHSTYVLANALATRRASMPVRAERARSSR